MSQIKVVDVNGKKYIIEPFKGRKGFKLKAKLLHVLSPALESFKTDSVNDNVSEIGLVIGALQSVIEKSDSDEIFDVVEELISGVKTEAGAVDFDTEFSQNYTVLYKLMKEVIEVNYKDVFSLLGINVD